MGERRHDRLGDVAYICRACILRYRGVRDACDYVQAGRASANFVCVACLGALQSDAVNAATSGGASALNAITHAGSFKVNVSLPPAAAVLRDVAVSALLTEQGALSADAVSMREGFKLALCGRLEAACSAGYHPDAEAFVDVAVWHTGVGAEVGGVFERAGGGAKRKRGDSDAPSAVALRKIVDGKAPAELRDTLGPAFFPPKLLDAPVQVKVTVSVAPFLIAGSYRKLSRRVSQTPWYLDMRAGKPTGGGPDKDGDEARGRHADMSVEEVVVSGMRREFAPERVTFTPGGREDVDVRMLGRGRPFLVDVINSRVVRSRVTPAMVAAAARSEHPAAAVVTVHDLRLVPRSYAAVMRACETDKRKHYRCVVWTERPLGRDSVRDTLEKYNESGGVLLKQKTPLRVLHRRTLLVRERRIWKCTIVRFVTANSFVLDVFAAAGTYIKEFVHSDCGRTTPSVSELLGCEADILQLDVAGVEFDPSGVAMQKGHAQD